MTNALCSPNFAAKLGENNKATLFYIKHNIVLFPLTVCYDLIVMIVLPSPLLFLADQLALPGAALQTPS